jgi:hypothetical protein
MQCPCQRNFLSKTSGGRALLKMLVSRRFQAFENRAFSCFRVKRKLHDAPLSRFHPVSLPMRRSGCPAVRCPFLRLDGSKTERVFRFLSASR